jgi:hypothetical protein
VLIIPSSKRVWLAIEIKKVELKRLLPVERETETLFDWLLAQEHGVI